MKTTLALTLALALGSQLASTATYSTQMYSKDLPVLNGSDQFKSSNGQHILALDRYGRLALTTRSVLIAVGKCTGGTSWTLLNDGRLAVYTDKPGTPRSTCYEGAIGTSGNWKANIQGDISLSFMSPTGTGTWGPGFTTNDVTNWALQPVADNSITSTAGAGAHIFLLDSGVDSLNDPSGALGTYDQMPPIEPGTSSSDELVHGTRQALIIKSKFDGMAQGARLTGIKITQGNTNVFTEMAFVTAVEQVVTAPMASGAHTKIINWSGRFMPDNTGIFYAHQCAIQWAFYSGVYVIGAAGNDGRLLPYRNPFMLTVGAATNTVNYGWGSVPSLPISNYGFIDIWGPGEFISRTDAGTSYAAAFVSSAAAVATNIHPQLRANPSQGYRFILTNTQDGYLNKNDAKVAASSATAGNRFVRFADYKVRTPTGATHDTGIYDYCSPLSLPSTAPNWAALRSKVSTTLKGAVVTNVLSTVKASSKQNPGSSASLAP